MGGLEKGKEASQIAIDTFIKEYDKNKQNSIKKRLELAIKVANNAVFDLAYRDGNCYDIGTTLVAATVYKDKLFWVSAGDSRAYLFRRGLLYQLTTDHIYANNLAEDVFNGLITKKEAEEHPQRYHLTSYL